MKKYPCQPLKFEFRGPDQTVYYASIGVPTYCRMTPKIVDDLGTAGILTKTDDFIHIKVANADFTYEIVDTDGSGDWVCRLSSASMHKSNDDGVEV